MFTVRFFYLSLARAISCTFCSSRHVYDLYFSCASPIHAFPADRKSIFFHWFAKALFANLTGLRILTNEPRIPLARLRYLFSLSRHLRLSFSLRVIYLTFAHRYRQNMRAYASTPEKLTRWNSLFFCEICFESTHHALNFPIALEPSLHYACVKFIWPKLRVKKIPRIQFVQYQQEFCARNYNWHLDVTFGHSVRKKGSSFFYVTSIVKENINEERNEWKTRRKYRKEEQ